MGYLVAAELVGDQHPRGVAQAFEQLAAELLRSSRVPSGLDQDIEHDPVLIDGAPKVVLLAVDGDDHLVEVPRVARLGPPTAQTVGIVLAELPRPLPDLSWETSTPRASISSETSRNERAKR